MTSRCHSSKISGSLTETVIGSKKKNMGFRFLSECSHACTGESYNVNDFVLSAIFEGPRFVESKNLSYHRNEEISNKRSQCSTKALRYSELEWSAFKYYFGNPNIDMSYKIKRKGSRFNRKRREKICNKAVISK